MIVSLDWPRGRRIRRFPFSLQGLSGIVFTLIVSFHIGEFMVNKVCVIALILFTTACSLMSREAPTEDVDKAAILFFQRLTAGQLDLIYNDSAKSFQEKNQKWEVVENLKKMKEMGQPDTPVRTTMTFGNEESKRTATPTYIVNFDQTRATVILKFMDESGEWKLDAFEVRQRAK